MLNNQVWIRIVHHLFFQVKTELHEKSTSLAHKSIIHVFSKQPFYISVYSFMLTSHFIIAYLKDKLGLRFNKISMTASQALFLSCVCSEEISLLGQRDASALILSAVGTAPPVPVSAEQKARHLSIVREQSGFRYSLKGPQGSGPSGAHRGPLWATAPHSIYYPPTVPNVPGTTTWNYFDSSSFSDSPQVLGRKALVSPQSC